jgi:hypothetical protein
MNIQKINSKITELLLEDGGVTAVSPARRTYSQNRNAGTIPTGEISPLAQRDTGYLSYPQDAFGIEVPKETSPSGFDVSKGVLPGEEAAKTIGSVTNPYAPIEDLLNQLNKKYGTPESPFGSKGGRETTFIKPYVPGSEQEIPVEKSAKERMYGPWDRSEIDRMLDAQFGPSSTDVPEVVPEQGPIPVEPDVSGRVKRKWVAIPQLYPSRVPTVVGATPSPEGWAQSWKSLQGIIPHKSEFAGEQRVVPLPNERFMTIPGQTGKVETRLNPEVATDTKWAQSGEGTRVLGGSEAIDKAIDIAVAEKAKKAAEAAARKAGEFRSVKAASELMSKGTQSIPKGARSAAGYGGKIVGSLPRIAAHFAASAPYYMIPGEEAYELAREKGYSDLDASAFSWVTSVPMGAAFAEGIPAVASALGGGASVPAALGAGASIGGAAATNPWTLGLAAAAVPVWALFKSQEQMQAAHEKSKDSPRFGASEMMLTGSEQDRARQLLGVGRDKSAKQAEDFIKKMQEKKNAEIGAQQNKDNKEFQQRMKQHQEFILRMNAKNSQ